MIKHIATVAGVGVAVAFVVVFFIGRTETKHLTEVAPRVATQTGVTLGTSRHVVYLLACSGQASKSTIETQAVQAGTLARQQRLSDREAVREVLAQAGRPGAESLKGC